MRRPDAGCLFLDAASNSCKRVRPDFHRVGFAPSSLGFMGAATGVVDVGRVLLIAGGAAVSCVAVQAAGELRKHGLVGWLWRQPASFSTTVVDPVSNVSTLHVLEP